MARFSGLALSLRGGRFGKLGRRSVPGELSLGNPPMTSEQIFYPRTMPVLDRFDNRTMLFLLENQDSTKQVEISLHGRQQVGQFERRDAFAVEISSEYGERREL